MISFYFSLEKSLESQNVKNSGQIMVLMLSQSSSESQLQQKQEEETKASVSRTRQAAEALSNRKDSECASNNHSIHRLKGFWEDLVRSGSVFFAWKCKCLALQILGSVLAVREWSSCKKLKVVYLGFKQDAK